MKVTETKLAGCFVLEPRVFNDERGYFFETYNKDVFEQMIATEVNFVQDNESSSTKGVLRGLHFQKGEHAQAKLVRVISGEVLDIMVDLREESPTFLQYESIQLSSENKKQIFIPRGFAHGFIVLSETAVFNYKCDNFYNKEAERGILFNDPTLNIDWQLNHADLIVSDKDLKLPTINEYYGL